MNIITLKSKIEQSARLLLVNSISSWNESVLIVEYPKSGGTWLGQLVSEYLKLPFPRNRMPIVKKSVFHSHYLPKWRIPMNKKILFLVRDGRDVIISLYYHQLLWNDKNRLNPKDVLYHRARTGFKNFDDIQGNLDDFIHYTFSTQPSKWKHFTYMGNWNSYNRAWLDEMQKNSNIYMLSYESLLKDTHGTLKKILSEHFGQSTIDEDYLNKTVKKFSFENQTKRKKGEEQKNNFLRKGISGDWKNYFGEKEKASFKLYTGDLLIKLGYEQNLNW